MNSPGQGTVVDAARTADRAGSLVEALLVRALAHDAIRDRGAALADLSAAHANRGAAPAVPGGPEPLSEREVEALRLLATDLTGPDIARQLFMSVNTFRTHTRHIFTKLSVKGPAGRGWSRRRPGPAVGPNHQAGHII